MEEVAVSILSILFIVVTSLLLSAAAAAALGDQSRSGIVSMTCSNQRMHNSTAFVTNFVSAAEEIRRQIQKQGYGVATAGQGPDSVYVLAQCYGDVSSAWCLPCYNEARTIIPRCCPDNGGKLFLDGCFMRHGNYSFFLEYSGPKDRAICGNRTTKSSAFQETARRAVLQAAFSAPKNNGYARVEMPVSGTSNDSAYVLANCWRTLNASSCRACLEKASVSIQGCLPWDDGRALYTGCFMRYSHTDFSNPVPTNGTSRGTPTDLIAVVVSSTIFVAVAAIIGAYIWKHRRVKKKKRRGSLYAKKLAKILRNSGLYFEYTTLEKATGGFNETNKVGQGGFGSVYKGVLPDGREIAVKRHFCNSIHGAADFCNEINIISSVVHTNLVRLLGCSCSGAESLLVYEFLPNKGLDRFIFNANEGKALNWEKRFVIIIGIAEGLVYLHENPKIRIVHRDIKASNILLDTRFRAKIADFGLARSFQENKNHISTKRIAGTLGYLAPEYLIHGTLTEKMDVYSFGVLLLEIVTGRQHTGSKTLEEYSKGLTTIVWVHFQQGKVQKLIDSNLMLQNYHTISMENEVLRVVHVGLLCIQEIPELRPSMSKALQMLKKKDELLSPPTNPPFIDAKSTFPLNFCNSDSVATISQSTFYPR